MKRLFGALWQTVRTHVSHWFAGGAMAAAIGCAPDEWFRDLFSITHAPADAIHLWSLDLNPRWALIAAGGPSWLRISSRICAARVPASGAGPGGRGKRRTTGYPGAAYRFQPADYGHGGQRSPLGRHHSRRGFAFRHRQMRAAALPKPRPAVQRSRHFHAPAARQPDPSDGGAAAIAGRAVHGLGGVGKTRAAVEYGWAHRADYIALALLDAETPEKLHAGLAALAGPLRLPEQTVPEDAVRMEAALTWLSANPGWFLILDNIDSEPALVAANRLLGRLQGGHVVLTSRLARFPRGVERLDLDVLTLDDAASFLLEATATGRRTAPDDEAQARTLAEELGRLALALEMAAATIEASGLGFAAYRTLWQGNRARVIGWADQKITGYHHAVAETWRTSVDQLTEAGRRLLERLAFLAPDPVPMSLLDTPVPGAEAEDAAAALDDLAAYSLVTRDIESETFVVHRLVQDVTRRGLEAAGLPHDAATCVDASFSRLTGRAKSIASCTVLNTSIVQFVSFLIRNNIIFRSRRPTCGECKPASI